MHGQGIDTEPAAQTQLAQGPANHLTSGGDQRLNRGGLYRRQLVHHPQFAVLLQTQKLGHFGAQNHAVTGVQFDVLHVTAQRGIAAQHVDQAHALAFEQVNVHDRLSDQLGILGDRDLGEKLHPAAVGQQVGHAVTIRQQPFPHQTQIDHPPDDQNKGQRRNLKNPKGFQTGFPCNTVHQQVGRGPDQRAHPAKDRSIRQRNQQLGHRQVQLARQFHKDGDHHHHDRGVVHKRRRDNHKAQQTRQTQHGRAVDHPFGHPHKPVKRAGPRQARHHHEHRGNRPWRGVGQHRQRLIIADNPEDQHQRRPAQGHDLGRVVLPQKQQKHTGNDQHGHHGLCRRGKR